MLWSTEPIVKIRRGRQMRSNVPTGHGSVAVIRLIRYIDKAHVAVKKVYGKNWAIPFHLAISAVQNHQYQLIGLQFQNVSPFVLNFFFIQFHSRQRENNFLGERKLIYLTKSPLLFKLFAHAYTTLCWIGLFMVLLTNVTIFSPHRITYICHFRCRRPITFTFGPCFMIVVDRSTCSKTIDYYRRIYLFIHSFSQFMLHIMSRLWYKNGVKHEVLILEPNTPR